MKSGIISLAQQQQQIQAGNLTPVLTRTVRRGGVVVKGLELGPIPDKGLRVFEPDGDEGAGFEDGARGEEGGDGGLRIWYQGVGVKEAEFGVGEGGGGGRGVRLQGVTQGLEKGGQI